MTSIIPIVRALLNAILYCFEQDFEAAQKAIQQALLDLQEFTEADHDSGND
ncbi:MAG: hypothetical protein KatS3mg054_0618 [Chloroflexus sp.]|nr:MAG: hypothetical protein KatS3mg054_0618 [Chloroflexus sp.]